MKRKLIYIITIIIFASCTSSNKLTLIQQYPAMYEENPLSIAIMPPINQTTHAEAKDYFYTTMYTPLCEKGYYVYSPYLTLEFFQQESAYDAELFLHSDLIPFQNILGADALMFTIIKKWEKRKLMGGIEVSIEYILRSTKTGEILYSKDAEIFVDTKVADSDSFLGLILNTAITAATEEVVAGRKCNAYILMDMPSGKYSPIHKADSLNYASNKFIKATIK